MPSFDYAEMANASGFGGVRSLSDTSGILAFNAVAFMQARYLWMYNDGSLTDSQWDILDAELSLCLDELMYSIVGSIVAFVASPPVSSPFLPCDGSTYQKSDYPLLYDALNPVYILDVNSFTVPDLRDRFPVGAGGNYLVGAVGGLDNVSLSVAELPSHSHGYQQPTFGVDIESVGVPDPTGVGNPPVLLQTGATGGNDAHENRPPFHAVDYFIVAK